MLSTKLAEISSIESEFKDGDKLLFSGVYNKLTKSIVTDLSHFNGFFTEVDKDYAKMQKNIVPCEKWLQSCHAEPLVLHADLFMRLHAFQSVMQKRNYSRKPGTTDRDAKAKFIEGWDPTLSALMENGFGQCVQKSILATEYLRRSGIDAKCFSGTQTDNLDDENHGHCVVIIEHKNSLLIYDPAQPVVSDDGMTYPSLIPVDKNGYENWLSIAREERCYMRLIKPFSGKEVFYGAGNMRVTHKRYVDAMPPTDTRMNI